MTAEHHSDDLLISDLEYRISILNESIAMLQGEIGELKDVPDRNTAIRLGFSHIILTAETNMLNYEKLMLEGYSPDQLQYSRHLIAGLNAIVSTAEKGIYIPAVRYFRNASMKQVAMEDRGLSGHRQIHQRLAAGYARISMGMPPSNGLFHFHPGMLLS